MVTSAIGGGCCAALRRACTRDGTHRAAAILIIIQTEGDPVFDFLPHTYACGSVAVTTHLYRCRLPPWIWFCYRYALLRCAAHCGSPHHLGQFLPFTAATTYTLGSTPP